MATMTEKQKRAMESGHDLAEAAQLLTGYLSQTNYGGHDEHLIGLINLLARKREDAEESWGAFDLEHAEAEDAAVRQ